MTERAPRGPLEPYRPRPFERLSSAFARTHARIRSASRDERGRPNGYHASIPGAYAWAVTVAPLAWARGTGAGVARAAVGLGFVFLAAGPVLEPRLGERARFALLWGFVSACAVAWGAAPAALSASHLDPAREVAGMLGWGLFAFAAAAPPLRRAKPSSPAPLDGGLRPHRRLARGDRFYVAGGTLLALALQLVGLDVATPERALLVRFVTLAAGLAMIGASTDLALARHALCGPRVPRARLRAVLAPVALLAILLLTGVLVANQG